MTQTHDAPATSSDQTCPRPKAPEPDFHPWAMGLGPQPPAGPEGTEKPPWAMGLGPGASGTRQPPPVVGGHKWTWQWQGTGVPVIVTGGATKVDTDDLYSLASAICAAASRLEDAHTHASHALGQVGAVAIPTPSAQPAPTPVSASEPPPPVGPPSYETHGVPYPLASTFDTPPEAGPDPQEVRCLREQAEEELRDVRTGTVCQPSLYSLAETLRGLSSDIEACASVYEAADTRAHPSVTCSPGAARLGVCSGMALGTGSSPAAPVDGQGLSQVGSLGVKAAASVFLASPALASLGLAYGYVRNKDLADDAYQAADVLLSDPGTEQWVRDDYARLLGLAVFAVQARSGQEAATVQAEISSAAERLDPWVTARLPEKIQIGTQVVDTATLTPAQRATAYLALAAARSGQERYGTNKGVEVRVRPAHPDGKPDPGKPPVRTVRVPPADQDPMGLKTPVEDGRQSGQMKDAQRGVADPPTNISETINFSNSLQNGRRADEDTGTISILEVTHTDGAKSHLVIIPGTTDWGSGSKEPQDLLTNLQGAAGMPTDMESAVVTAMRAAGIQPGEDVALYGHSQGGITAVNVAADPQVREQFHITTVLTAGAPTANADLPPEVSALHLENTGDAVPALDASPTPTGPSRVVVQLDTHESPGDYPHGAMVYSEKTKGLEASGDPAVTAWSERYKKHLGVGEPPGAGGAGPVVKETVFDINRVIEPKPTPKTRLHMAPAVSPGLGSQASPYPAGQGGHGRL